MMFNSRSRIDIFIALAVGAIAAPLFVSASACPSLSRNLARGARGDDVRALQQFLVDEGYLFSDSLTGTFGPLTERAIQGWQAANHVVSSGSATTTGWGAVGPKTRAAILEQCDASGNSSVGIFTSPLLFAASSTSNGASASRAASGNTLQSCKNVPKPQASCATSWQNIAGRDGCVQFWYCLGMARTMVSGQQVVVSSSTQSGSANSTEHSQQTLQDLLNSIFGAANTNMLTSCLSGGSCSQSASASTTAPATTTGGASNTYWCPNGTDPATGYWSQTPCQEYSSSNAGTYGSYGGGALGQVCAPNGATSFTACPYMSNCMNGGTYLQCVGGIWVQAQ